MISHGMIPVSSPVFYNISVLNGITPEAGHAADTTLFCPDRSAVDHLDTFFRTAGCADTAADAAVARVKLLDGHVHFA